MTNAGARSPMETMANGEKLFAPSADRTRHAIFPVLRQVLPASGTVLEIASGTGQHAVHFAQAIPGLTWQPSDTDPRFLKSIQAWREEARLPNLLPPLLLDVTATPWPAPPAAAVFCSNMIHIAPWRCTQKLLEGAAAILPPGGPLALYGAYLFRDRPNAPSNLQFDSYLRQQDVSWGVRNLEEVAAEAEKHGMRLDSVTEMPGNNFMVVFRRTE
ncbi:MAG: class I SAM-dependent methyltransferase [Chloroflexi bacterium]|nr:class I SAM-dependent methyltransferase [Chloroflexota bacterium]